MTEDDRRYIARIVDDAIYRLTDYLVVEELLDKDFCWAWDFSKDELW